MPRRIKVPVNLNDLCSAFEDCRVDYKYFLDLETGEILYISDEFMDDKEREEVEEKVDEGFGERYISIPETSPEEGYGEMRDFLETVKDGNLKEKLYIALNGKGAFRRFKDTLLNYPDERKRWFVFESARLTEKVKEWLEIEGIEIIEVRPNS